RSSSHRVRRRSSRHQNHSRFERRLGTNALGNAIAVAAEILGADEKAGRPRFNNFVWKNKREVQLSEETEMNETEDMKASGAIATGVMELVAAVRLRKVITNEWLLVLAGIASIAFGILLLFQPAVGALALIWWIGAWALIFGILLMILAFRMRNWKGFIAVS